MTPVTAVVTAAAAQSLASGAASYTTGENLTGDDGFVAATFEE